MLYQWLTIPLLFITLTTHADIPRPHVEETIILHTTPSNAWQLIGDFNALPAWHPAVHSSEIKQVPINEQNPLGIQRIVTIKKVGADKRPTLTETLIAKDETAMTYTYRLLNADPNAGFPDITNYTATLQITRDEEPTRCRITWKSEFDLSNPENQETAQETIAELYRTGLQNLKRLLHKP